MIFLLNFFLLNYSTGASRGIGLEIGKLLASKGANVAVAAKTAEPHAKLPGTIFTAVEEIEKIGKENNYNSVRGLPLQVDIRDAEKVEDAIQKTIDKFGNLDIIINNASAINMSSTLQAKPKSYDLMNSINVKGTWLVSKFALPHLLKSAEQGRNPHILTLSPPLHLNLFQPFTQNRKDDSGDQFKQVGAAYSVSKLGMSIATYALAAETFGKVACNTLWPYTLIGTSAMKIVSPNAEIEERRWRSPSIVAEAAIRILEQDAKTFSGQMLVDELYLREHGFNNEQLKEFSLGGRDIKFDELAEDLFISKTLRDEIVSKRGT